jgi:hypothetical protein
MLWFIRIFHSITVKYQSALLVKVQEQANRGRQDGKQDFLADCATPFL